LAPDAAERIAGLTYNPLAVVHVHADTELRGMGYQVSFNEELVTRGVTFNDSLFGRRGVYTIYLGGSRNPWVADADEARLAEVAVDEFRRVTRAKARVLSVARARMPAWDLSWQAITGMELPDGIHLHNNWAARPGLPGRLGAARRLAERLAS
jgi:oxygen-dependent protoporphyrinogen oxidase